MKGLIIAVLVVSFVLLGACANTPGPSTIPGPTTTPGHTTTDLEEINGSGKIIKSEIDIKDFNKVEVSGEGVLVIE